MRVILKRKKILQALAVWDMLQHVNNNSVQCKHNVKALSVAFFTLSAHETKWLNTRGLTCIIIQKSSSFEYWGMGSGWGAQMTMYYWLCFIVLKHPFYSRGQNSRGDGMYHQNSYPALCLVSWHPSANWGQWELRIFQKFQINSEGAAMEGVKKLGLMCATKKEESKTTWLYLNTRIPVSWRPRHVKFALSCTRSITPLTPSCVESVHA